MTINPDNIDFSKLSKEEIIAHHEDQFKKFSASIDGIKPDDLHHILFVVATLESVINLDNIHLDLTNLIKFINEYKNFPNTSELDSATIKALEQLVKELTETSKISKELAKNISDLNFEYYKEKHLK